jgi:hypothetical protein
MAAPDELQQLLALSRDRVAYQNPLFQAVTQLAYSGLPTYARQGTQLTGSLNNAIPAIAPRSGMSPATAGVLGGLAGAGLNSLGPQGNMLKALIDGVKKLIAARHARTIQGNKPYPGGALTGGGQPSQYPFPGMAGNEGMDPNRWPGGGGSVTTDEIFSWPNDVFNDPTFLNSQSNGMPNDPSGGSGIGPGMQGFRGGLYPALADPSEE